MKTIWKTVIETETHQRISLPEDARILSAHVKNEKVCLWSMVNPKAPQCYRTIFMFGTGQPIPGDIQMKFIGTVLLSDGALVYHVFEELA